MISRAAESKIVCEASSCGTDIYNALTSRETGRAGDLADLSYAYHLALTMMLRDTDITTQEGLAVHRIVERTREHASAAAVDALTSAKRLREVDA